VGQASGDRRAVACSCCCVALSRRSELVAPPVAAWLSAETAICVFVAAWCEFRLVTPWLGMFTHRGPLDLRARMRALALTRRRLPLASSVVQVCGPGRRRQFIAGRIHLPGLPFSAVQFLRNPYAPGVPRHSKGRQRRSSGSPLYAAVWGRAGASTGIEVSSRLIRLGACVRSGMTSMEFEFQIRSTFPERSMRMPPLRNTVVCFECS
jgi:hypothetical protein